MPLSSRDYYRRGKHPPYCTCVNCCNKRLGRSAPRNTPKYMHRSSPNPKRPYIKREYPNSMRIIANIILLLIALFAIGLVGGGIYALNKYSGGMYSWVSQKYSIGVNDVSTFIDDIPQFILTSKNKVINSDIVKTITNAVNKANTPPEIVTPQMPTPAIPKANTPIAPIPTPPPISLQQQLTNPTYQQMLDFLLQDDTDLHPYEYPTFVCEDFAKMLQDHAQKLGWRCVLVTVQLNGYPDPYNLGIPSNTGHALNAFQTTDKGLIYIDSTRTMGLGPFIQDSIVDITIGQQYIPVLLFPPELAPWGYPINWQQSKEPMGIVTSIAIQ